MKIDELFPTEANQKNAAEAAASARFRCNRLGTYWVDSMDWISKNLGPGDRVTSWWDYGHWINYFGDRKTVLRNEHASRGMIGEIAYSYIVGTPQDLAKAMNYFDSRYALFDMELITSGSSFGGKYGALNYLGCVHAGKTALLQQPGTSDCEFEHSPERILISKVQLPQTVCTISESQNRNGLLAYQVGKNGPDLSKPIYCVGEATLRDGRSISGTYYLDRKDENGDLVLSKGFINLLDDQQDAAFAEMVYNLDPVWPGANGTWVAGIDDAKTAFYSSNLYRGYFLGTIPGFELVYKSANSEVKIYRMVDFAGNKEGRVDPESISRTN
jgi:hypothetical protein